jgi:hypothetical protein
VAVSGFYSAGLWYQVGASAIIHSFFSTVCVNLEQSDWGSRFPNLMNDLYSGQLTPFKLEEGLKELMTITRGLQDLPSSDIVWDAEDTSLQVPDDYPIPSGARNLSECFVTSLGENMIQMLTRALRQAIAEQQPMIITTLDQIPLAQSGEFVLNRIR